MSRYIDAEWIRNVYADFEHYENREDWTTPIANVLAVIDDAPSIDIVRCGECIYWKNSLCQAWHRVIPKDEYCSIGERDEPTTQTETQNSNLTFEIAEQTEPKGENNG